MKWQLWWCSTGDGKRESVSRVDKLALSVSPCTASCWHSWPLCDCLTVSRQERERLRLSDCCALLPTKRQTSLSVWVEQDCNDLPSLRQRYTQRESCSETVERQTRWPSNGGLLQMMPLAVVEDTTSGLRWQLCMSQTAELALSLLICTKIVINSHWHCPSLSYNLFYCSCQDTE